jgi:hypothetical protein
MSESNVVSAEKHVFISYAHEDRDFVDGLAARLEKAGVAVWYDRGLRGGGDWPDELAAQLRVARTCVVVFSPDAVTSDWVKEEIHYARIAVHIPVVPILLRDCEIPLGYTRLQYVDFRGGKDGFPGLLTALQTTIAQTFPPNPFHPLTGRIADPQQVFGRDREIAQALTFLRAGSSVALIGPAGVGKSSLLTKLLPVAPERLGLGWTMALLDLQNVADEGDFYAALCTALGIPNCRGYALVQALRGQHILLCLDEVEKMTWDGFSRGMRSQLRGLAEVPDAPLKLVLAARTPLDRLFPDSEGMTSPLAGICLQVDIGPWDETTSSAFLQERLMTTGVGFSAEQMAELALRAGGYPARLVHLAFDLYKQLTGGAS